MEVGERHDIRFGRGAPENVRLLECVKAGVYQKGGPGVSDHAAGGPPAMVGHGGPGTEHETFHNGGTLLLYRGTFRICSTQGR